MPTTRPHPKPWLISPEEFAALRHSCFMSRKACANFLRVSPATVRAWERGRTRPNWAAVRLLRLYRLGDLGALHDMWRGWTLSPTTLWSPDNRGFDQQALRFWWITVEQARFWRRQYDLRMPWQYVLFNH